MAVATNDPKPGAGGRTGELTARTMIEEVAARRRVWPSAHPGKTVIPANMNAAVDFMIQCGLPRADPPGD